jgi:hypothetical protein
MPAPLSGLPWSVDVGAMFDGHDVDAVVLVVDTVDVMDHHAPLNAKAGSPEQGYLCAR